MVDTSEHILLVAALFIFAMLQLVLTRVLLNNSQTMIKTELDYTAVALAQNIADESRQQAFDEATTGPYTPLEISDFSEPGPDAGEEYPNFDDFDDYHGYTSINDTQYGSYETICRVEYMNGSDLTEVSPVKTAYKRLYVQVVSETYDTTAVTYIKSYY